MSEPSPAKTGGSDDSERLRVDLGGRGYDIIVGDGLITGAAAYFDAVLSSRRVAVVSDETVAGHHLPALAASLDGAGIGHHDIVLPPGEGTKSFGHFEQLLDGLLEARIERGDMVVALGGGVVGDLAGFAASVLRRGVGVIQVPTTLLAQVDSAVGGKTGIDTRFGKNLVGSFHQPSLVLADTGALATRARRELLAGYAEVVKYGLLGDAGFFDWLEDHGAEVRDGGSGARRRAVVTSCATKARIVASDEFETGARALLNLGHTFGHAIEAEAGFDGRVVHGEAVAVGMVLAFELSARLGLCSPGDAERVRRHLQAVGLPTTVAQALGANAAPDIDAEVLIGHMAQDKKVRDGKITFVLVRAIGDAFLSRDVPADALRAVITDSLADNQGT